MLENNPNPLPKPAEATKVQPKKETIRKNLPPRPTVAPTIKIPAPAVIAGVAPAPGAPVAIPDQKIEGSRKSPKPGQKVFDYVAMDSRGKETKGTLYEANQDEAIGRLKQMGYFPTKVVEVEEKGIKKEKWKWLRDLTSKSGEVIKKGLQMSGKGIKKHGLKVGAAAAIATGGYEVGRHVENSALTESVEQQENDMREEQAKIRAGIEERLNRRSNELKEIEAEQEKKFTTEREGIGAEKTKLAADKREVEEKFKKEQERIEKERKELEKQQAEFEAAKLKPLTTEERLLEIERKLRVRAERKRGELPKPKDIITSEDKDFWGRNKK
ncbi:hypothetical protein A3H53_01805 [Candidatus Nomurabacteria bacterium RIFCSPLOWO2_02_FULL_40_10]|uniref:Uncharacterized protein n=2 Tax=Candidatus Nomuraibacteriota TaxID=1752729 RepID=A0A1F6XWJ4_9BACT|nr:MAG: hypothetical protein A2642_02855 [Candidatus Nomurabacteria bacterium RIFCSPHIGHO2_01_FULL_39_10]OGI98502.1 MAG: hypothetical protein A3H53_01805 [Candidatus Nomurabacteria bacterium RIFCSPLOWO2_02_FULL_40_10]